MVNEAIITPLPVFTDYKQLYSKSTRILLLHAMCSAAYAKPEEDKTTPPGTGVGVGPQMIIRYWCQSDEDTNQLPTCFQNSPKGVFATLTGCG